MQHAATYQTLSVAVFPRETIFRNALLVTAAVAFIAFAAQVTWNYPFIETRAGNPVPITGQTFAVLVTGALLGSRLGTAAVLAYL
ncbi:MAG: biotin transporter BioY, partial [Chloroflexi bacterium]|nr:biotin transporter BioY [Chloroflexota bacterium]